MHVCMHAPCIIAIHVANYGFYNRREPKTQYIGNVVAMYSLLLSYVLMLHYCIGVLYWVAIAIAIANSYGTYFWQVLHQVELCGGSLAIYSRNLPQEEILANHEITQFCYKKYDSDYCIPNRR